MAISFEEALTGLARFFTVGRIIVGVFFAATTAWAVSFYVADYVAKASVGGLTAAVQNLQSSLVDLSTTVRAVNQDIAELRSGREALAVEIASRVGDLNVVDSGIAANIVDIQKSLQRIESYVRGELITGSTNQIISVKSIEEAVRQRELHPSARIVILPD